MNPLATDLNHILAQTPELWEELRGQRLFITGGTGFFGCWLLESFVWANDQLGLNASAVVLTRDPAVFQRKAPHLANHPAITLHAGDVQTFAFPAGRFSHVIHAASQIGKINTENPLLMFDTMVAGTRHTLEFARQCGATNFLLTSSGAVYGHQPPGMTHIPEEYPGAPSTSDPVEAHSEGKRTAELLCTLYAKQYGLHPKIARCFAFVGPYLPLDTHFAIGNFIRDALAGGPLRINGDGTPYRSYLYAADLAVWLWTILLRGQPCRPYNVGSEDGRPLREIAQLVAKASGQHEVQIAYPPAGGPAPRYVPAVGRAGAELGLQGTVDLDEAIRRTLTWHQKGGPAT